MNTYFMQKPRLFAASLGVVALALLPSCQDEDFGYSAEQIAYETNFKKAFGDIPADKSWDMSSYANDYDSDQPVTRASSGDLSDGSSNVNLNENEHYVKKEFWEVPSQTLQWLENNLIEQKDNRWLGSNFVLKLPENSDFAIVPIYQGKSAINSSLYIKINGYNLKEICPRSKDIQVKRKGSSTWENIGYYDGCTDTTLVAYTKFYNNKDTYKNVIGGSPENGVMHPSYTDEAAAVQAKPIYFRTSSLVKQDGGYMYLDLINDNKMWQGDPATPSKWDVPSNTWTSIGDHLTSINPRGQMVAFNLSWDGRPSVEALPDIHEGTGENHKKPSQVLIIGCEDAHGVESDFDVNDVVYMIIGYPYAPTIVPTTEIIKKRYMCEDLGATDDFDFNDIVVDVTQTMEYELVTRPEGVSADYTYPNDKNIQVSMNPKEDTKKQYAKISHVCGTLPFQVKVGNYWFKKITDPTQDYDTRKALSESTGTRGYIDPAANDGWNPNVSKEITGWNPKTNNIKIYVEWNKYGSKPDGQEHESKDFSADTDDKFADFANGEFQKVTFPKNGDVPYMIAVDQDIPWVKERADFPEAWINGDFSSRPGVVANQGSSAEYLDYGNDTHDNEAVIWNGEITGIPYNTGLDLGNDNSSVYYNGLVESFGKDFDMLIVYTDKPGDIGLAYNDSGWKALTSDDADGYSTTSGPDTEGLYKTVIMLSDAQQKSIEDNGLIVIIRTQGLAVRRVSTIRTNNPITHNWIRQSYTVKLSKPENGRIYADDRNRPGNLFDDKGNEITPSRAIPFNSADYRIGTKAKLTAVPDNGYVFDKWVDENGNTMCSTAVYEIDWTEYNPHKTFNLRALFKKSVPVANVPVSEAMMHNWTGPEHGSTITSDPSSVTLALNEPLSSDGFGYVFGNNSITANTYADLCDADFLVAELAAGANVPLFHYNNGISYSGKDTHESYHWEASGYLEKYSNSDGTTTVVVNIKKIREAEGTFHLNAITTYWEGSTNVTSLKIDNDVEQIRIENQTEQLASGDNQQGWTNITELTFNGNRHLDGSQGSVGFGCNSGITANDYVDLSSYTVLKIAVEPDATKDPRILFNCNNGQFFEVTMNNQNSALIKKDDQYSSSQYFGDNACILYYVNLAEIKRTQGKVHLHVIKKEGFNDNDVFKLHETPKVKNK